MSGKLVIKSTGGEGGSSKGEAGRAMEMFMRLGCGVGAGVL